MTKEEKRYEIDVIKGEANQPKSELFRLMDRLQSIGAIREANSLGTVIERLETWQNKLRSLK